MEVKKKWLKVQIVVTGELVAIWSENREVQLYYRSSISATSFERLNRLIQIYAHSIGRDFKLTALGTVYTCFLLRNLR
jgi:hypothetical protein